MRLSWAPAHPQYNFFSYLFYKYYIIDFRKSQFLWQKISDSNRNPRSQSGRVSHYTISSIRGIIRNSLNACCFLTTKVYFSLYSMQQLLEFFHNSLSCTTPFCYSRNSACSWYCSIHHISMDRGLAAERKSNKPSLVKIGRKHNNSGNQPCSVGVRRRCSFGEPLLTICHCDDTNVTHIAVRLMAADFCLHPSEGSYWDRAILVRADAIGPKCRRQGLNLQLLSANRPVLPLELHRHKLCRKKGKQQVASRTSFFVL